ncbi:MAG: ABC transporter permease [Peptococcaceae bacterium]|jgi:osmoprotectant transport system permease protein|nr:ABC transporter permease [Peptococcaceae bacterium]
MSDLFREMAVYLNGHPGMFQTAVRAHMIIFFAVLLTSFLIGAPLGVLNAKKPIFSTIVINIFSALKMIPSLALLLVFLPILGTGFWPAFIALTLHALPTILISAYTGFKEVDVNVLESAAGMGLSAGEILLKVEIPLAMPIIFTGIRTCTIDIIASATLAAYIGAGGLGEFVVMGLSRQDHVVTLIGSLSIGALSLAADFVFFILQKILLRYQSAVT